MEPKIRIKLKYQNETEILTLKKGDNLNDAFKNFLLQKKLPLIESKYYFYLIENEEVKKELSNEKNISELDLNENDEIFVSYKELQLVNITKKKVEISECFQFSHEKIENFEEKKRVRKNNIKNYKIKNEQKKKNIIKKKKKI